MRPATDNAPQRGAEMVDEAQHPFREMLAMFLANRAAMVASIVLAFVVLATIFGPML